MGPTVFEDFSGHLFVYDAEGTEQYWLRMESVADYAGFSWWEDEDLGWTIRGFYYNGNYCYSNRTIVAVALSSGERREEYLIDTAKLEQRESVYGSRVSVVTDSAVLFRGEYVEIDNTACWMMRQNGQWGYVDHNGNVLAVFDDVARFHGDKGMVIKDGYAYFIDENMNLGEWKIPAESVAECGEVYSVMTEEGQKCFVVE